MTSTPRLATPVTVSGTNSYGRRAANQMADTNDDLLGAGFLAVANVAFGIGNNGTAASPGPAPSPTTVAAFDGPNGAGPHASLIAGANGDFTGAPSDSGASGRRAAPESAGSAPADASTTRAPANRASASGATTRPLPGTGLAGLRGVHPLSGSALATTGPEGAAIVDGAAAAARKRAARTPTGFAGAGAAVTVYDNSARKGRAATDGAGSDGLRALANGASTTTGFAGMASAASTPILTTLVSFNGTNGSNPDGLIADLNGNLFGTTQSGGAYGYGVVFEIRNYGTAAAPIYASSPTILATFDGKNGKYPGAGLIVDVNGNLFGTTVWGGSNGNGFGVVFEIQNNGTAAAPSYDSSPMVLAAFKGPNGSFPYAGLVADANGDLFGTTWAGGPNDWKGGAYSVGIVFEIRNNGTAAAPSYATPTILVSFEGTNCANPDAGLILDVNGNLFGTTYNGGANSNGVVFEIRNNGTAAAPSYASTPTVLVSFDGTNGAKPSGDLLADANGDLFGTTESGGAYGKGVVFEIRNYGTAAAPSYASIATVLVSFDGIDGSGPSGTLIADANGDLFGMTLGGGTGGEDRYNTGVVFKIWNEGTAAAPSYASRPAILATFPGRTGSGHAGLFADANGDLFAATSNGGSNRKGAAFEIANSGFFLAAGAVAHDVPSTISGAIANQATTSEAPVHPFSGVTIGDANVGATETLAIRLAGGGGLLHDGAGFSGLTGVGGLYYILTGTAAAITAELEALVFTPFGQPNTTFTTTFTLLDQNSTYATSTLDSTTSVVDTDPAVPSTISGTLAGQATTSDEPVNPFSGVTIDDWNAGATDTLTITLSGPGGTLTGDGLTDLGGGVYQLSGAAADITAELDALVFTPTAGTTTFTLSDQNSAYATPTVDSTTSVIDTDPAVPSTISGTLAGQATTSDAPVNPFSGVTIGDENATATDTLTITLSGAGGTLSGSGLTFLGGGVYQLSGTAAAITSALQALVFTPTAGQPNTTSTTTFTLSDTSSAYGTPAIDSKTSVIDTDPAVASTITGTVASQATTSEAPVHPFSGVTIGDANANATDTLTITLSGAGGTLSGSGLTFLGGGVYQLSGTAAEITSALHALQFVPTAGQANTTSTTTFTLSDLSNACATPTVDLTTSVVDVDPAAAPTGLADSAIANGWVNAARDTASQALTGFAAAGTIVTVYDNGVWLGQTTADANGAWSFGLGALADGAHNLTATATGAGGIASPASAALAFAVDTTPPAQPTVASATAFGSGATGDWILRGAGETGSWVTVYDGSTELGRTLVRNGVWGFLADDNTAIREFTVTASDAAGNATGPGAAYWEGTPGDDVFAFASEAALSAAALIDGGAGVDTVEITSGSSLTDADFAHLRSIEVLALTGASSVALGANAAAAGVTAVTLLAGSAGTTSIADSNPGTLAVDATGLGAGATLVLTGSATETITGLACALDASGDAGALTVTATGNSPQSVTTGTGNMSITDNGAGSMAVNAAATGAGRTLTLAGSASETVSNLAANVVATGLTGALTIFSTGTTSLSVATGSGATTIAANLAAGQTLTLTGGANATVTGLKGNLTATGETGILAVATAGAAQTVTTGSGSATIADGSSGVLTVKAAALAAGNTLTLTGGGAATVTSLNGALDASGDSGTLSVTATGATAQTIATGSGAMTVTDNAAGGSLVLNAAAMAAGKALTLAGSANATVNGLKGNLMATGETGILSVATAGAAQSVTTGSGSIAISDGSSGVLTINAAALAAGSALTLTGGGAATVTNLKGALDASGDSGSVWVTATGATAQTIATSSGAMSITDNAAGGSLVVNAAAMAAGQTLTLAGSANATVNGLRGNLKATSETGLLAVATSGAAQTVTTGSGSIAIADGSSGLLSVNAAALAAGSTLTLTGGAATVTNLKGALDASGDSGSVWVTATGVTAQTIATGSGAMSVTDNAAGGSLVVNAAAMAAGQTLTLAGSANSTVNGLRGNLKATSETGLLAVATAGAAQTVTTGSGSATIADGSSGVLTVNAAALAAASTLTLTGGGTATVTNLKGSLDASGNSGPVRVTATGAGMIETGGGADTIIATLSGNTIEGGGGGDTISTAGHTAADTFVYAATSDSLNKAGGHDTIAGFQAAGAFSDLVDFSQLDPSLAINGKLAGSTVAAHSIAWLYSSGGAMIYVNDTASALSTTNTSLMEITLTGVTSGLSSANFKA